MAELSVFAYHPGEGGLYACDGRFKLLTLLILTVTLSAGHSGSLLAAGALLVAGLFISKVPLGALLGEMRFFGVFLGFIWLVRALGTPGRVLLAQGPVQLTLEGAAQGGVICWRMATILVAGLLFTRTTRMAEVRAATAWLLTPVPLLNGRQLATMLGLLVRFIPLILTQAKETRQAQLARGIDGRRNPARRLTAVAFPLLRSTFLKSDRIAVAMAARGYTGATTPFTFTSRPRDWGLLGLAVALAAGRYFT
jgi:energy-coupling factor transporter transmembrane protein EcfT